MPIMKKGDILNYFGQSAEVVDFDKTHVVIKLVNGTKICTNKSLFE